MVNIQKEIKKATGLSGKDLMKLLSEAQNIDFSNMDFGAIIKELEVIAKNSRLTVIALSGMSDKINAQNTMLVAIQQQLNRNAEVLSSIETNLIEMRQEARQNANR